MSIMPLERPSPSLDDDPQPLRRASTLRNITSSVTDTTYKAAANITKATRDAINADVPLGAWAAAAEASSKAPTLGEIRKGSFVETGWTERAHWQDANGAGQRLAKIRASNIENEPATDDDPTERIIGRQRQSTGFAAHDLPFESDEDAKDNPGAAPTEVLEFPPIKESYSNENDDNTPKLVASFDGMLTPSEDDSRPKITWTRSTIIGLRAFWKWFLTPFGFLVTIYALNVVAWGGMLFLLLLNAAPAMCWALDDQRGWIRDCDNLQSSRRIWLETDSQILNALFCVTAFGLIPWRFRDLYYLLRWRLMPKKYGLQQKLYGLRTLGGIYQNWVRLPGSQTLDHMTLAEYNAVAFPNTDLALTSHEANLPSVQANALDPRLPWKLSKTPPKPLTGVRAPPTALWKIDFFVWCNVWNTFLQGVLCGFMWGMNRFNRPSWSTGLFIGLSCIVSGVGGIMSFVEAKKIKKIEGVRPTAASEFHRGAV
jgi:hypothetical protein